MSQADIFVDLENEDDDVFGNDIELMNGVQVTDTDWTAETMLSQLRKGNISLNPKFQRRDAWDDLRKSRFIESLLLNIPIPQLVLAEVSNSRGKFFVIDGKQRLLALLAFSGQSGKPLRLQGLTVRTDLNGLTWQDMVAGAGRADDVTAFENSRIRTTFIQGYKTERALYTIFHRLNSGSVSLSPQELRHVLHPGNFIDFAFEFSEHNATFVEEFGRDGKPDFRMRDVEVLIRYFGFHYFFDQYRGNLKEFLDDTVKALNTDWKEKENDIKIQAERCVEAIKITRHIFGEDAFCKATSKGFETRFNRAVFDVMVYYFSDPDLLQHIAPEMERSVKEKFLFLCTSNDQFRRSLESTTKTVEAALTRFELWGSTLAEVIGFESKGLDKVRRFPRVRY